MDRWNSSWARLARSQVEIVVRERRLLNEEEAREIAGDPVLWDLRRACFVSIKKADGSLRGCMGTILPTASSLGKEILSNAVAACSRDPRFAPVSPSELPTLILSVDVLSLPEPVADPSFLDPRRYGVIVSRGGARGVLLPDLEGVDSVEAQLRIACAKAGIGSLQGVLLERFTVERHHPETERCRPPALGLPSPE